MFVLEQQFAFPSPFAWSAEKGSIEANIGLSNIINMHINHLNLMAQVPFGK